MSSKKSRATAFPVIQKKTPCTILIRPSLVQTNVLFMPNSEALLIRPSIISPLKGRNTITRNSTKGIIC